MDGRRRGSGSMELPTSHRRSQNERGSGEQSLAGSTKGMEDEWVSAVVLRDPAHQEANQLRALRLYEKILYGMGMSFAFNALVVTNGTLIDYYEDTYKLDTSFLGLINFFTGMLTVFATIGFGVLSDRSPWTRFGRRKPYVAILTPLLAISVALLYSPRLVSDTSYIPVYFAATFMVSQVVTAALMVVIAAWGVALTREAEDRGGLFMVDAVLDLIGFLTGVFITSENAEKEGGMVLAILFLVQNALLLQFVPTEPPAPSTANNLVVPFIPSLHLSLQNAQFVCLLKAASWGSIVSSAVNLLPLFLQMVMGVAENDVDEVYASYVRAVVAVAFFTIFAAQPLNRSLGRIRLFKLGILSGVVYGVLAFGLSFTSLWYFYLTVVPAGIFGGIVMVNGNVLLCNSIDYDELITGYRRHSFYQCLIYAPVTFFGVAGSSLPLSIISAIGNTDLDAHPSTQVVTVLRLWMTVCVSVCLLASCYCLSNFRLTDEVQRDVCAQLQRREAGETFTPIDPLQSAESEGSPGEDLEVVPPECLSEDGSFLDLYLLDSEVAQLLDKDGKRLCLIVYGVNLALMLLYTLLLIWRTVVSVHRGNATKAMLKSCLLMFTTLSVVYEGCRLPAFLWVHRSMDRDLIKRFSRVAGVEQRLPFFSLMPAGAASLLIDEQKQADEESEGSLPAADSPMDGPSGASLLTKAAAPQVVTPGCPPAFSVQLPPSQQANEQRQHRDMSPPQQQQQPDAAASRPAQESCSQPSFQHDRVLRPPQATPTGRPSRSFGSVQVEGPVVGDKGGDMRYVAAATVADRVVEELADENETLRKSLSTLRKDYERTNMELKERIRALQLELEQDRSRIINEAVSGDYAKLREIRDALLEAHRELPDVLPTKTLGQVTEAEVKQVLQASNFSIDHLQEAAAAIENCISDTSYDAFTRNQNGQIISQNLDHEMLFPLAQQYGKAAAELVLIKKQELDQPVGVTPRTVLWHDGRELTTVDAVRRLIEATVEARHASLLSGVGAAGQRNGGVNWEEWLGFQKGRVGTAPNEPTVFGDDVVEGYKAWVVRARQVSARTADMYLNDLNRVFRGCLRAMGQPHEVMDRQTLRDLCVEKWELVGQEAANQKSKSVDQGLNYLKRYMRLDEEEILATVPDDSPSDSGTKVQALGESVLEGFSVWLHENTSTRQCTWDGYGRAVDGLIADVLKSEAKEGTVLEADTVRDFVTQHREALEERGAADARQYVGAGVRYLLRFLGLIEPMEVDVDVVDKDEDEHVSERKAEAPSRNVARVSASRAARRNSDRLPLNTELADQFAYYLVKENGMKEGTAVEYIRYVGAWINDLVEMEGVDAPAAGSLDRESTMEFITSNETTIRDYGRELKKASKKGKVSAWRHFMIFMGLADADEDWITGSSLNKAPTQSRPVKSSGNEASARAAMMSGVLKASFTSFLVDQQAVPREEVDAYVSSATRSLTAILKAAKAKPPLPMGSSEVRAIVEGHGVDVQQHLDALKKRPRAALRHLLAHVGAPLASASESSSAPASQSQGRGSEDLVEAHKEGPLGVPLVSAFCGWLTGERPMTSTAAQSTCKTVGSLLSQAYAEAGLAEETHELVNLQAAGQFLAGMSSELNPALDAIQSVLKSGEAKDWAMFKTFVEHEVEATKAGMAAAGSGGEEDVVGPELMDEFAADAVERGLSGQTAALQVLRVLSQGRKLGEAGRQEQLQTKEEVQQFLMPRQSAVRRILFHAPYHARPFECFLSFLGIEEPVLARFVMDDTGKRPAFNLSMGLCADLLLWLVEYRAMTIVQAEFVIRALDRLVAFLHETVPLQSEQKPLGVSEVADLVTERRDEITALVQAAADGRFKQAYSLFSLFHFKQDPMAAEHGPMRDSDEHREEEDDDDDDDMDDDDPWGLAGHEGDGAGHGVEKKTGSHKGRVAVDPPSDFMSDSLKAALGEHVQEELGIRQAMFPACERLIFGDLGSFLPKGGSIKTKEDLKKLVLSRPTEVKARKSRSGIASRAWNAVLSFVDLSPADLGITRKTKTQPGRVSISRDVKPVNPRPAKQTTKKPPAPPAPPVDNGLGTSGGVTKKALTVRFRKDFKRFMRTSDTGLSRDTRKFYSDLICEVLRVVMVRKGMKDTNLGAADQAKAFVTQHAKEINQACDTFAKMSAWENFQVYVGLPRGSLGSVSNLSKEARDAKTAGTKKKPAKRGDDDDKEESSSGGGGRGGKGVKKRKRAEVHYAEDEDDDDMDGDDEVDVPASETDNDQSDSQRRAASRKRKRPELALDAKLASEFEAWLHATKGITSGTCYSGWVRQIVRKVYAMVGKPIKVVSLNNLPIFLEQYKKAIEAELALPRKDGRNSAWRHFLTYTGADKLVIGKASKVRGSTSGTGTPASRADSESGEGTGNKNWNGLGHKRRAEMSASDGDSD